MRKELGKLMKIRMSFTAKVGKFGTKKTTMVMKNPQFVYAM